MNTTDKPLKLSENSPILDFVSIRAIHIRKQNQFLLRQLVALLGLTVFIMTSQSAFAEPEPPTVPALATSW